MARHITDAALALIKRDEGLRLTAYRDIAGILTIGYGHTGHSVVPGQVVTEAQATDLLRGDIAASEAFVEACTRDVATSDAQFSAMVSLTFNIGTGAFRGSSVLREHRAGHTQAAGDAFLMWSKAHVNGGLVMVPGLLRRRAEERAMYLERAVSTTSPVSSPAPAKTPAKPPVSSGRRHVDESDTEADRLNAAEAARR